MDMGIHKSLITRSNHKPFGRKYVFDDAYGSLLDLLDSVSHWKSIERCFWLSNQVSGTESPMPSKTARAKPQVATARQLFLYGDGDGKRVLSTQALCKATGIHEETVRRRMPEWQKEAEELLANTTERGLALRLSREDLIAHEADQLFIRDKMNSVKWEVEKIDDVIEKLEGICENFSLNTDNGDLAIRLFENYLRASMNRKSLLGTFLALKKEWDCKMGIDDLRDAAAIHSKTISKGKAQLEIKKFQNGDPTQPRIVPQSGVFVRRDRPATDDVREV